MGHDSRDRIEAGYLYRPIYKEEIKEILNWTEYRWEKKRRELIESGVIYYQYERLPTGRKCLRVKAFPYRLFNWMHLKSKRGEKI